jgi:hypothetical protein
MEPFNIKLPVSGQTATLTILTADQGLYKIVYYGGIMGALRAPEEDAQEWTLVPKEELVAGDLPFYQATSDPDRLNILLDETTVRLIGQEIQNAILTGTEKTSE